MNALARPRGPLPPRTYWVRRMLLLATALALVVGVGQPPRLGQRRGRLGAAGRAVRAADRLRGPEHQPSRSATRCARSGTTAKTTKKQKPPPLLEPGGHLPGRGHRCASRGHEAGGGRPGHAVVEADHQGPLRPATGRSPTEHRDPHDHLGQGPHLDQPGVSSRGAHSRRRAAPGQAGVGAACPGRRRRSDEECTKTSPLGTAGVVPPRGRARAGR